MLENQDGVSKMVAIQNDYAIPRYMTSSRHVTNYKSSMFHTHSFDILEVTGGGNSSPLPGPRRSKSPV